MQLTIAEMHDKLYCFRSKLVNKYIFHELWRYSYAQMSVKLNSDQNQVKLYSDVQVNFYKIH